MAYRTRNPCARARTTGQPQRDDNTAEHQPRERPCGCTSPVSVDTYGLGSLPSQVETSVQVGDPQRGSALSALSRDPTRSGAGRTPGTRIIVFPLRRLTSPESPRPRGRAASAEARTVAEGYIRLARRLGQIRCVGE